MHDIIIACSLVNHVPPPPPSIPSRVPSQDPQCEGQSESLQVPTALQEGGAQETVAG